MASTKVDWASIGAQKGKQDPNDPSLTGTYKDAVDELSPEQKSVLINFPKGADPSPFSGSGGGQG